MSINQFTEKLQQLFQNAVQSAMMSNHPEVTSAHLLKAMSEDGVLDGLFSRLNIQKNAFNDLVDRSLSTMASVSNPCLLYTSRRG